MLPWPKLDRSFHPVNDATTLDAFADGCSHNCRAGITAIPRAAFSFLATIAIRSFMISWPAILRTIACMASGLLGICRPLTLEFLDTRIILGCDLVNRTSSLACAGCVCTSIGRSADLFLIGGIAARLAPRESRDRVWIAGLWLAALCPFIANYCTTELTEVLAVFFTALSLWFLVQTWGNGQLTGVRKTPLEFLSPYRGDSPRFSRKSNGICRWNRRGLRRFGAPGDSPVVMAAGAVLAWRCWRPVHWRVLFRTGLLIVCGVILPLALGRCETGSHCTRCNSSTRAMSELPGEYVVVGVNSWTGTWMWRMRDVFQVLWKVDAI